MNKEFPRARQITFVMLSTFFHLFSLAIFNVWSPSDQRELHAVSSLSVEPSTEWWNEETGEVTNDPRPAGPGATTVTAPPPIPESGLTIIEKDLLNLPPNEKPAPAPAISLPAKKVAQVKPVPKTKRANKAKKVAVAKKPLKKTAAQKKIAKKKTLAGKSKRPAKKKAALVAKKLPQRLPAKKVVVRPSQRLPVVAAPVVMAAAPAVAPAATPLPYEPDTYETHESVETYETFSGSTAAAPSEFLSPDEEALATEVQLADLSSADEDALLEEPAPQRAPARKRNAAPETDADELEKGVTETFESTEEPEATIDAFTPIDSKKTAPPVKQKREEATDVIANEISADKWGGGPRGDVFGPSSAADIRDSNSLQQMDGNPKPEYPESDRLNRREGRVVLIAYVNHQGKVLNIKVKESDGSKTMTKAAMNALSQYKFFPGQAGWISHTHVFKLKGRAQTIRRKKR